MKLYTPVEHLITSQKMTLMVFRSFFCKYVFKKNFPASNCSQFALIFQPCFSYKVCSCTKGASSEFSEILQKFNFLLCHGCLRFLPYLARLFFRESAELHGLRYNVNPVGYAGQIFTWVA